ncbi:MAG: DeoR/GlpR family DNA-binding transcription regulator [Sphaerochaetaceae bacterium]
MKQMKERHLREIELVHFHKFLSIKQLAEELNVSEMTIRRDLTQLTKSNSVRMVYGGVTIPVNGEEEGINYSLAKEQNKNKNLKEAIVDKALEFLQPNDVIFLDSGTTVQLLVEKFPADASYTIITSSFNTLELVVKLPNSTIICPGGVFSQKPLVFYDLDSTKMIRKYRANKAFIGATGFELNLGLTCGYLEDAPLKQAMIESSQDRILLIDSTKFGKVSTCPFATIDKFSTVITDSGIPEDYIDYIKESNIELIIV